MHFPCPPVCTCGPGTPPTQASLRSTSTIAKQQVPHAPWKAPAKKPSAMVLTPPACIPSCATLNPQTALSKVTSDSQAGVSASCFSNHHRCLRKRLSCSCPTGLHWRSGPRKDPLPDDVCFPKPSQTTLLNTQPSPAAPCQRSRPPRLRHPQAAACSLEAPLLLRPQRVGS